jgi:hypothetical protein
MDANVIWAIITSLGTLTGWTSSIYLFRRQKRAQVGADEARTASEMVDLVKKSFETSFENLKRDFASREKLIIDSNENLKKSNDKLCRRISSLEKAISAIDTCPHRVNCPVIDQLPDSAADDAG